MTAPIAATRDAYFGLDDPTWEEWRIWHRAMLDERASSLASAGVVLDAYDDPATAWSDRTFRQLFLFMYDASFFDRDTFRYRTPELLERWNAMFGRVDSVLLWHAYPRLGFDARTQFDFYRDMPGGIAKLRAEVTDVLHAHGVRVFVDYKPWDAGSYAELADVVLDLDADGVMLDTMAAVPEELVRVVRQKRAGVVFAPELRPSDTDLGLFRQSWAQWFDVGDAARPSIYRHRWLVPRHRQLTIRRWDTSRRSDIVYSFCNGSGLILWDNVFGSWSPYSREDRRLIAETAAVLDRYEDLFVAGEWLPLLPTGVSGLDASSWALTGRRIVILRNRTKQPLRYRVDEPAFAFWGARRDLSAGDAVGVEPDGVQAVVFDEPGAAGAALEHFDRLSARANVELPDYDERTPRPRRVSVSVSVSVSAKTRPPSADMIVLPGGAFTMKVKHPRRECGCYPLGVADASSPLWGWYYEDILEHEVALSVRSFALKAMAVTNAEFLAFVQAATYRPADEERFLRHLPRGEDSSLPRELPPEIGALPVTFVSLADARAYAAWHGQRLPTEAEWQWAAEGCGEGRRYPWGAEERAFPARLRVALDASSATPHGIMGLSGNAWELTDSEHTDGHTRFVMLRGGVYLPPGESGWVIPRGPRPNDFHAKYILLSDGLDRSETVTFRTAADP
jgi:formylglycine-generating enzyme required for sulfatase activity